MKPSLLIAFGGNALDVKEKSDTSIREEFQVARRTMETVVELVESGHSRIVLTHGNGPQVGRIFLQQELTKDTYKRVMPLDVCGADSQGRIGYALQQAFDNICRSKKISKKSYTVITQTIVDKNDKAFLNPTKPVGQFYSEEEAKKLAKERGWVVKEDAGRGWRRVVPSPSPKEVVEYDLFTELLKNDHVVIGAGGGGIPVIINDKGEIEGVEAVIDKDRTSSLLATSIGVDIFVILTEAAFVSLNFKKPNQVDLRNVNLKEMEKYFDEGHFAEGSMKPKVEAAMNFIRNGGKHAIIANLFELKDALEGKTGTHIYP